MASSSSEEYDDIYYIYGYCDDNAGTAVEVSRTQKYEMAEYLATCSGILEKAVDFLNRDVKDYNDAV
jgi:hypothetical protein